MTIETNRIQLNRTRNRIGVGAEPKGSQRGGSYGIGGIGRPGYNRPFPLKDTTQQFINNDIRYPPLIKHPC